jgi:tetratricopeptide (TPR) repeat protein
MGQPALSQNETPTMSTYRRLCPRCHLQLAADRSRADLPICDSCGFVMSGREYVVMEDLESFTRTIEIALSVVVVAIFMLLMSWGSHTFEVLPLLQGQWFHSNSTLELEKLIQIGTELKKYELVEAAYIDLVKVDRTAYMRLGKFQMKRAKFKEAAEAFRLYFKFRNTDAEAHYLYAMALSEIGKVDLATQQFDYVLNTKPGILQVTVIQNYVRMLTRVGRFAQARKVIEVARRRNTKFMETEYRVILERLHTTRG